MAGLTVVLIIILARTAPRLRRRQRWPFYALLALAAAPGYWVSTGRSLTGLTGLLSALFSPAMSWLRRALGY